MGKAIGLVRQRGRVAAATKPHLLAREGDQIFTKTFVDGYNERSEFYFNLTLLASKCEKSNADVEAMLRAEP